MKRIIQGSITIVATLALVVGASGAFFSDEERSEGNMFTAGAIDLTVDSVAHYNGMTCFDSGDGFSEGYKWHPSATVVWNEPDGPYMLSDTITDGSDLIAAIDAFNSDPENVALIPQAGDECDGTWDLRDLGGDDVPATTFFNFADLKPGDSGENTISLHLENNDAWACVIVDNMVDEEVGDLTEPEVEDGDDTPNEGELSTEIHFFAWADDGDNIFEDNEIPLFSNEEGPASDVLDGRSYELFTPTNGNIPMSSNATQYIGLYWCYGDIDVDGTTITCDGGPVTNLTQADKLTADIGFYVEQARNNPDFECPQREEPPEECEFIETFADEVVFTDQGLQRNGTDVVLPDRSFESYALGAPQSLGTPYDNPVVPDSFYSLGFPLDGHTAEIILSFNDNYVVDAPGNDLKLWEVTGGSNYPEERVDVYLGNTSTGPWTQVGDDVSRDADIDIFPVVSARYVRIVDASNLDDFETRPTSDGFDLDAVQAVNCVVSPK